MRSLRRATSFWKIVFVRAAALGQARDVVRRDRGARAQRVGQAELLAEIGERVVLARRDHAVDLGDPRGERVGEDLLPLRERREVELREIGLLLRRGLNLPERGVVEPGVLRGARQARDLDPLQLLVRPPDGDEREETLLRQSVHHAERITRS